MRCSPRPPSVFVQYEKITGGKEVCSAKGALGGAQQATSKLKSLMTMTFDPDKPFRATWDVLMLLLVSYCVVAMPLQVAFEAQLGETTRTVQLYFDAFFDVLFLLDVLINARTAFTFEGVMVNNRSAILRRYLRTWFLLDIMASVLEPVEDAVEDRALRHAHDAEVVLLADPDDEAAVARHVAAAPHRPVGRDPGGGEVRVVGHVLEHLVPLHQRLVLVVRDLVG